MSHDELFQSPTPRSHDRRSSTSRRRPAPHRARRRHAACIWLTRCLESRCEDSWRLLLKRYGMRIRRILALMAAENGLNLSRAEVEELTQELYLHWLHRGGRFDGDTAGQFWRFVSASARHLVIDEVRRITADKRSLEFDPWQQVVPLEEVEAGERGRRPKMSTSCGHTPEAHMLRSEEFDRLWQRFEGHCLEVVEDARDIDVLERAVLDGHTSRELSRELHRAGRPLCRSTIDSWVHRLRLRLEADGLRLPRRRREPESVWPPRVGRREKPLH